MRRRRFGSPGSQGFVGKGRQTSGTNLLPEQVEQGLIEAVKAGDRLCDCTPFVWRLPFAPAHAMMKWENSYGCHRRCPAFDRSDPLDCKRGRAVPRHAKRVRRAGKERIAKRRRRPSPQDLKVAAQAAQMAMAARLELARQGERANSASQPGEESALPRSWRAKQALAAYQEAASSAAPRFFSILGSA